MKRFYWNISQSLQLSACQKNPCVSINYWSILVQKFPSQEPFTSSGGRNKKIARKIPILWGKILRHKQYYLLLRKPVQHHGILSTNFQNVRVTVNLALTSSSGSEITTTLSRSQLKMPPNFTLLNKRRIFKRTLRWKVLIYGQRCLQ